MTLEKILKQLLEETKQSKEMYLNSLTSCETEDLKWYQGAYAVSMQQELLLKEKYRQMYQEEIDE